MLLLWNIFDCKTRIASAIKFTFYFSEEFFLHFLPRRLWRVLTYCKVPCSSLFYIKFGLHEAYLIGYGRLLSVKILYLPNVVSCSLVYALHYKCKYCVRQTICTFTGSAWLIIQTPKLAHRKSHMIGLRIDKIICICISWRTVLYEELCFQMMCIVENGSIKDRTLEREWIFL